MEDKLSSIFKWSCINCKKKRFDLAESGSEMTQTAIDILGHLLGAISIMDQEKAYLFVIFITDIIASVAFFKYYKYFGTDFHMMPLIFQNWLMRKNSERHQ